MSRIPGTDRAAAALAGSNGSRRRSYRSLSSQSGVASSTLCHRNHGRVSRREANIRQQYITPLEEEWLCNYVIRMAGNGCSLPVKFLRALARSVVLQRNSCSVVCQHDAAIKSGNIAGPGKNWPQKFRKRHAELANVWNKRPHCECHGIRNEENAMASFKMSEAELDNSKILSENTYYLVESGAMLSLQNRIESLVSKTELLAYKNVDSSRTMITVIECTSADGRVLEPLIIWPAQTHHSTRGGGATSGWHHEDYKSGYSDESVTLKWMKQVFDPQTKAQANGRPRRLIYDKTTSHIHLKLKTFCETNNILLYQLPSHPLHGLKPCDKGPFGLLKTAYSMQVDSERQKRGGTQSIQNEEFLNLYCRARQEAFTKENLLLCWYKS